MVVSVSEEEEVETPAMETFPATLPDAETAWILKQRTLELGESGQEPPFQLPDSQPRQPGDPLWSPAPTETASSPASSVGSKATAVKGHPPAKVLVQRAMDEKDKQLALMRQEFAALQAEMDAMRQQMAVGTPAKQRPVFSPPPPAPASGRACMGPESVPVARMPPPPPPNQNVLPKAAAPTPKAVAPKASAVAPVSAEETQLSHDFDLSGEAGFLKTESISDFACNISHPAGTESSRALHEASSHVPAHSERKVAGV